MEEKEVKLSPMGLLWTIADEHTKRINTVNTEHEVDKSIKADKIAREQEAVDDLLSMFDGVINEHRYQSGKGSLVVIVDEDSRVTNVRHHGFPEMGFYLSAAEIHGSMVYTFHYGKPSPACAGFDVELRKLAEGYPDEVRSPNQLEIQYHIARVLGIYVAYYGQK